MYLNHIINKNTPKYADNGSIELEKISSINMGHSSNSTKLSFSSHTGTHIDAPLHFDQSGDSLDMYSTEFWFCKKPYLIEYTALENEILTLSTLKNYLYSIPEDTDLLLIKTGFESYRNSNYKTYIFHGPGIAPDVGLWLRNNRRLKMIGFDFISLSSYSNRELGREAHRAFLSKSFPGFNEGCSNPILIIEDMHLSEINNSVKSVVVAPLLYENADGAPVTVIAEK